MSERVLIVGGNKATRPVADFMVNISTEFYVGPNKSGAGDDGRAGRSKETSLATLTKALSLVTASKNDIIYLLPGHAETIAAAGGININKIGVRVVGLGTGALRPTFTFSAVDATMTLTAASTSIENVIVKPSIDSVVSPIVVSAADCTVDIELQDASALVECVRAVLTTAAADRLDVKVRHRGFIAGNACVNSVRLVGVDTAKVDVDFYGVASTSIVEYHTTACHDIDVKGVFYNSGTTDLSKNVVDTVTGSTWSVDGFDAAAGAAFSGGSGNAIAAGDLSTIAAKVDVIDGYHDVPTADAETDTVMRDVVGRKTDAAVNDVAVTKSLMAYLKGIVNQANRTTAAKNVASVATANLFTVATGPIRLLGIAGHITTAIAVAANATKLVHTSTGGAAIDLCAALDVTGSAVRKLLTITGTKANAMALSTDEGVIVGNLATPLILTPGILSLNCAASTTGVIDWYVLYEPLAPGAKMIAA